MAVVLIVDDGGPGLDAVLDFALASSFVDGVAGAPEDGEVAFSFFASVLSVVFFFLSFFVVVITFCVEVRIV